LKAQSDRWQTGQFSLVRSELPKLLAHGVLERKLVFFATALDLSVPPLVTLTLATLTSFILSLCVAWPLSSNVSMLIGALPMIMLAASVGLAWMAAGKDIVKLSDVAALPLFILTKARQIPQSISGRMDFWKRTDRF
jgi:hypothetical protein